MGALEGRLAVVTGAAQGIGRAIAERFVAEGAAVALLDSNRDLAATVGKELDPAAIALAVDVGNTDSVAEAVASVIKERGEIGILVNNAATSTPRARITELSPEDWDRALRINLTGAFLMSRAVLPSMQRAGGGVIINVASQLGSVAVPQSAAYCTTKGGLLQFTRALALDHAVDGVRVNSLSPGAVLTPRLTALYGGEAEAEAALAPRHPIGRIGRPRDIAGAAVYLASEDAAFMTGADLVVDGGYLAQ